MQRNRMAHDAEKRISPNRDYLHYSLQYNNRQIMFTAFTVFTKILVEMVFRFS